MNDHPEDHFQTPQNILRGKFQIIKKFDLSLQINNVTSQRNYKTKAKKFNIFRMKKAPYVGEVGFGFNLK